MSEAGSIGQPAAPTPAAAPAPATGGDGAAPPPTGASENVTRHKPAAASVNARKAAATAAIEAARAGKSAPQPSQPPPAAEPAASPAVTPPPKQEATPAAKSLDEEQVAKMIRAAQQKERETYEAKQRLKQLEEENKAFREAAEKRKGMTPLELLEQERGLPLDQLHEDIVKGKYKPKTAEQLAAEKAQTTAESAEARIKALEQQLAEREQQTRVQQEHAYLAGEIKRAAESFPLLDAFDWAPARVRDVYYQEAKRLEPLGEQADLTQVMKLVQDGVEADLRKIFAHDGALKRLLTENKDRVAALLGPATPVTPTETTPPAQLGTQTQSSTGRRNDPASLTRVAAQDAGTRRVGGTRSTPSERKANALKAFLRAREAKQ